MYPERALFAYLSAPRQWSFAAENLMKVPVSILMVTFLWVAVAHGDDNAAINKLIVEINAAAKTNKERMLRIIVINTDVAASTLEEEKGRTGLSYGEIYVAHSLALASGKSFKHIVALKTKGQTWAQIAQTHNVSLKGSTASLKEMLKGN